MDKPNYYAVIPAEVRYDKEISDKAKLLYGEISSLCQKEGICWASNQYFANLYNTTERTIQRMLKELTDKGYIGTRLMYKENSKEVDKRVVTIMSIPPRQKCHEGGDKNVVENNTSTNNTRINKYIVEIIEYLNQKTHKKYTASESNKRPIKARLEEGFTVEDCKKVIDIKCDDWLNDRKMNEYLRPETLFRPSKFQSYLNQKPKEKEAVPVYNTENNQKFDEKLYEEIMRKRDEE